MVYIVCGGEQAHFIICRATIVAYNFFTDGFGKVADIAVRTKGRATTANINCAYC